MRKTAFLALLLGALAIHVQAEGWGGYYAGINTGAGLGSTSDGLKLDVANSSYFTQPDEDQFKRIGNQAASSAAALGSLSGGYNWQAADWVYGIEGEFGFNGLANGKKTSAVYDSSSSTESFTLCQSVGSDWYFSLRPRIGYSFGKFLLQASGGLAVANRRMRGAFEDNWSSTNFHELSETNDVAIGFAAGLGAEYSLGGHYSLTLDYLYMGLGSKDVTAKDGMGGFPAVSMPDPLNYHFDLNVNLARVGLNYHY